MHQQQGIPRNVLLREWSFFGMNESIIYWVITSEEEEDDDDVVCSPLYHMPYIQNLPPESHLHSKDGRHQNGQAVSRSKKRGHMCRRSLDTNSCFSVWQVDASTFARQATLVEEDACCLPTCNIYWESGLFCCGIFRQHLQRLYIRQKKRWSSTEGGGRREEVREEEWKEQQIEETRKLEIIEIGGGNVD